MNTQGGNAQRDFEYSELMAEYTVALIRYADKWGLPRDQTLTAAAMFFAWAVKEYDMDTLDKATWPGNRRTNIVEMRPRAQDWRTEGEREECTDGR